MKCSLGYSGIIIRLNYPSTCNIIQYKRFNVFLRLSSQDKNMVRKQRKWTSQEIADLERLYPDPRYSPEQITCVFSDRSWKAIVRAAQRYGIHRSRSDLWKPEENAILESMYTDPERHATEVMQILPGRTWKAIQDQADKHNLHRTHPHVYWAEEEVNILKHMYPNSQYNPEHIMEALPRRSWIAITSMAQSLSLRRPYRNPHRIDRQYFAQIDTPYKAYDLGLIAADGNISDRGHISLWLQKSDTLLVTNVRDRIAPGIPIRDKRNACGFSIGSKEMANDLSNYGIGPRKTYSLDWPRNLPDEFVVFFLLGYFDGDGSLHLYMSSANRKYWRWSLVGTRSFLFTAHYYIQLHAKVTISEPSLHNKLSSHLYAITTTGQKAVIIDRMLNASGLGLLRKHLPQDA